MNTFEKVKNEMFPDRNFSEIQNDFYKFAYNLISSDRDEDRITVFSARCGLGKSTFLQIFIKTWLTENTDHGLIIVTDNLQRLKSFKDCGADERIAYLTAENKATETIRQKRCPVLLMSTQRFAQSENMDAFLEYKTNGKTFKRDTIIFDETPYFLQTGEIRIEELNLLHTALNDGISDNCNPQDKAWVISQYDTFREYMIQKIDCLENQRKKTTYLFWQDFTRDRITENDEKFFSIIEKHMPEIKAKYQTTEKVLSNLSYLMQYGGIFRANKAIDSDDYSKGFIICEDVHDKYLINGVKTFVFDASANTSELYPYDAEWLTVHDCNEFTVSLDWLHIHLLDVNTTRNALFNKPDRKMKLDAIKGYISRLNLDMNDSALVTYKQLAEDETFSDIGFDEKNTMYFGNVKGSNAHMEKHKYIQVGYNRMSGINYINLFLTNNEDFGMNIRRTALKMEDSIRDFDKLLQNDLIDGYMSAEICADIIQNLYRTKARDITNTDRVDAYLLMKKTDNLLLELQDAFGSYGAKITVEPIDELQIAKIRERNSETNAKKILRWIDNQPKGKTFKVAEMLCDIGITQKQFNKIKEKNSALKQLFNGMKIGRTQYKI